MNLYRIILLISVIFSFPVNSNQKPIATDSRIKTLIYSPKEIFQLKLHNNYQSFIKLPKKEIIKSIAIGNSANWEMKHIGNFIFIKPKVKSTRTNLVIINNKDESYTFDLIALESMKNEDMTYSTSFYYPDESDSFDKDNSVKLLEGQVIDNPLNNKKQKIHYNYSSDGDKELTPSEIFDNGQLTFFKFTHLIPKIFVVKDDGSKYSTEMISYEGLTIINGVYDKLSLHYQGKNLTIIKGKS
ncbi:MAG: TrbG/VirB9 family P-type conjugative transfer protein [Rickettsiaceae bacterium H1]|nr:TrbG/VirB9 family P-type conjugative transfer protein [Rickettsiaceae bacterium H1]